MWHTQEIGPGILLIVDDKRVVGSINKVQDEWRVEILFTSRLGAEDLTFASKDYNCCLSFVQGVEALAKFYWVAPL